MAPSSIKELWNCLHDTSSARSVCSRYTCWTAYSETNANYVPNPCLIIMDSASFWICILIMMVWCVQIRATYTSSRHRMDTFVRALYINNKRVRNWRHNGTLCVVITRLVSWISRLLNLLMLGTEYFGLRGHCHACSRPGNLSHQAPVPLTIFRSNSKFHQNLQYSSLKCTLPTTTKFCTRHDSVTVVTCAKFRCDRLSIFETRALPILIEFRIRSKYR